MMFFSATYDQEVMDFAEMIVKDPIIIRLKREEESLDNIQQYYVKCANQQQKYSAVTNIYGSVGVGQAIIFCHVSFVVAVYLTLRGNSYKIKIHRKVIYNNARI